MPTAVRDVELRAGELRLGGLAGYGVAFVLLRWDGVPVAAVRVPVADGAVAPDVLRAAATEALGGAIDPARLDARRAQIVAPTSAGPLPSASVVICTRDRPDDLRRCLAAVARAAPPDADVLVVDNAPSDRRTEAVAAEFGVRYVVEPVPGLNKARATGARAARGAVVLYTDDDTAVDPGWYEAMRAPFADPGVGAASGLVLPGELETEAQELFEVPYGGFVRRFARHEFTAATLPAVRADVVGAGASLAVRRALATEGGVFDVPLDGGTPARSGGDTYALYRVLRLGYSAVSTPAAVTWHWHRRSLDELRRQLVGYGAGTYAFLTLALLRHREARALVDMARRYPPYFARTVWRSVLRRPGSLPLRLATAEPFGAVLGLAAGMRAVLDQRRRRGGSPRRDRAADRDGGSRVPV